MILNFVQESKKMKKKPYGFLFLEDRSEMNKKPDTISQIISKSCVLSVHSWTDR